MQHSWLGRRFLQYPKRKFSKSKKALSWARVRLDVATFVNYINFIEWRGASYKRILGRSSLHIDLRFSNYTIHTALNIKQTWDMDSHRSCLRMLDQSGTCQPYGRLHQLRIYDKLLFLVTPKPFVESKKYSKSSSLIVLRNFPSAHSGFSKQVDSLGVTDKGSICTSSCSS